MKNILSLKYCLSIIISFILFFSCENAIEESVNIATDGKELCPNGNDDAYTVASGGTLTINFTNGVLSNDADPGGGAMIASIVSMPKNGTLAFNADGSFTYKHDGSGAGEDKFIYVASTANCDNTTEPDLKSMAKVIITITEAANNVPTSNVYVAGSYTTGSDMFGCVFTDKNGDGKWETNHLPNSFEAFDLEMYNGQLPVSYTHLTLPTKA